MPVIGIGLLYQQGYFRQVLAAGRLAARGVPVQRPGLAARSSPSSTPTAGGRGSGSSCPAATLLLRVWQARVGRVSLYLLDSNHPLNSPWDRGITANLYAAGQEKRLLQELVLGVGG